MTTTATPLRRKALRPPLPTGPAPDPWRAFCDGMDRVHRAQAECRREARAIEQQAWSAVAAALASSANDQDHAAAPQGAMPGAAGARRIS